ncbi:tRNA (guanosine(46)-N7)-methyltransferase TrmB [Naumannella halotolerans]|uniref:tRNA (guanosine(46)-N7)-methyltransferase TrmB n=1 Tax=Naumannella halotolerans TaxID=993414 RepID=UPI00370D6BEE
MKPEAAPDHRREVVSFVRQRARMTPAQQRAWSDFGPRYLLEVPHGIGHGELAATEPLDTAAAFGREGELIVEIGSGAGDSLVAMAAERPDADILAFEVFQPGIAATMIKLDAAGVDNVRIIEGNGVHGLRQLFPEGSLFGIWVFFPDPWPKTKHHKRRLINSDFATLAASRLAPNGELLCATDWAPYATQMRKVLDAEPLLINDHPGSWAPRPAGRPITRFEGRGERAGRDIHDLSYRRR